MNTREFSERKKCVAAIPASVNAYVLRHQNEKGFR